MEHSHGNTITNHKSMNLLNFDANSGYLTINLWKVIISFLSANP